MSSFFYSLYIFDITHWWMWSWWKYFIILSMAILSPWRCPLSSRWFSIPFIIWWSYHLHYWSYFQDVVSCVNGYSPLALLSCSVYLVWCWHLWSTCTWVVFRVLCLPEKSLHTPVVIHYLWYIKACLRIQKTIWDSSYRGDTVGIDTFNISSQMPGLGGTHL